MVPKRLLEAPEFAGPTGGGPEGAGPEDTAAAGVEAAAADAVAFFRFAAGPEDILYWFLRIFASSRRKSSVRSCIINSPREKCPLPSVIAKSFDSPAPVPPLPRKASTHLNDS